MKRALKFIAKAFAAIVIAIALAIGAVNAIVVIEGSGSLGDADQARAIDPDCILVLGASVLPEGSPSTILRDRLDVAAGLYSAGVAPAIIVSGDNGDDSYNEVAAMKAYLVGLGVPSQDVYCDHCGFNTYDSMWRARNVFGVERLVVVTQTYHEYRALFNAHGVGMEARGVSSDLHRYEDQGYYDFREAFARVKDFGQVLMGAEATIGGEPVSLDQSGDET